MSWSKYEAQSAHIDPSDRDNASRHKDPLFFDDDDETMSEDEDFYQNMIDLEESIIRKSRISRSGIPTQEPTNRPTRSTDNSKNEEEKEKDEYLQRKSLSNLEKCDCCPRKKTQSTPKSVHFDDDSTRICYFYKSDQPNMISEICHDSTDFKDHNLGRALGVDFEYQ
ncbi:hypothetical protein FPSE_07904 [Fusarium pseudograminearum CS3096]|uniref:Uncharacterized protein n=1 Tax=Fusarium pseudograminearum (strain CS3096) TaxID=1028729 RepID=K3UJ23_FUSPC|nr:hypothetical protein FPSE_07904 [Fusarium pseudograminearum CS3096]EKJ71901.1 hypothetical protein FPSE_07904 [Fusarium pseudograminearum CS3096]